MTWKIKWSDDARKQLRKLDKKIQKDVLKYLRDTVSTAKNPKDFGKPLRYDKYGLWRYRVQDMRIVCQIREKQLIILVLRVAHRKHVYQ